MRLKSKVLLLWLALASVANAGAFTASVSGDWGTSATWGGAGVPGNGDTATINSNITVSVTDARIIGTSPAAGNTVLTLNQTSSTTWGTLAIKSGGTLALRGDCLCNGRFVVEGGGTLEFDASLASTPLSQKYKVNQGLGGTAGTSRFLTANTSSGNRATIKSNSGGGNGYINSTNFGGYVDVQYADFLRVGDSTNDALTISANGTSAQVFSVQDCTFSACGKYGPGTCTADVAIRINRNSHASSAGSAILNIACSTAIGSNERTISYLGCDIAPWTATNLRDFSISYVVSSAAITTLSVLSLPWASLSKVFVRGTSTSNGATTATLPYSSSDVYVWVQPTSGNSTNPHPISMGTVSGGTWSGFVIEVGDRSTASDGDLFNTPSPSSAMTYTITNNLAIYRGGDSTKHGGQIISALGGANATVNAYHNTYACATGTLESGGISFGETYAGFAGMFKIKSNLAYGTSTGAGLIAVRRNTGTVSDIVNAADCDYNGGFNLATSGTVGVNGYKDFATPTVPMFSTTTGLGAHDVSGDPMFVDPTRNLATWAVSRGSVAATYALQCDDAMTYLLADPSLIDSLLTYVRTGFAPRNPAYFKRGHDGGTIGAVEFSFGFFFDRFIRRRTSNDVDQSTPAWRDILDTSRRTRLRKAA